MAASAQRTKGRAVLKQSYVLECAGREWRALEGRTCREMTAGMGVGGGRKGGRIRRAGMSNQLTTKRGPYKVARLGGGRRCQQHPPRSHKQGSLYLLCIQAAPSPDSPPSSTRTYYHRWRVSMSAAATQNAPQQQPFPSAPSAMDQSQQQQQQQQQLSQQRKQPISCNHRV